MSGRVGIVGMGLMGSAFTHHLLQSGLQVQGRAGRFPQLPKQVTC